MVDRARALAPERVAKIKTLAGRRWHQQEQYWTVPKTNGAVTHLLTLFAGEPTEVDSSLDTAGASQQKKPFQESHSQLFIRLHVALRARHYACRTEQAYDHWIMRFSHFHHGRYSVEMTEPENNAFLTHIWRARNRSVPRRKTKHWRRYSFSTDM